MKKNINLDINTTDVLGQLERVQQAARATSSVIENANKASSGSFDALSGIINNVNGVFSRVGDTINSVSQGTNRLSSVTNTLSGVLNGCQTTINQTVGALQSHALNLGISELESMGLSSITERLTDINEFSREGLQESIDVLQNYGQELVLRGLESIGFSELTERLAKVDLFSREGFNQSIEVLGDYAKELKNNAIETLRLFDVRNSMTDAEGNFSAEAAIATAITLWSSITKIKDAIASGKNTLAKRREAIATKAGAKADAVGAKAKLALTAAKPFVGPVLIAASVAALAAGIGVMMSRIRSTSIPAMATGGVVSTPTMALVGEGRYPEAVVPLGDSPQFASMKADIAAAVMQGMTSIMSSNRQDGNTGNEIVLNIDGTRLARVMLPNLASEQQRSGYKVTLREV